MHLTDIGHQQRKLKWPKLKQIRNKRCQENGYNYKFDHGLTEILHDDLQRLDVADRVTYKLGIIMHRCRHGKAPQ